MKKIYIKGFILLAIVSILFNYINVFSEDNKDNNQEYLNGTLRCPENSDKCKMYTENGVEITSWNKEELDKVKYVEVTEIMGDYKVVKTVTRTDNDRKFNVQLDVKIPSVTTTIKKIKPAYIALIFDASDSMNDLQGAITAVDTFIDKCNELSSDINFALISFGQNLVVNGNYVIKWNKKIESRDHYSFSKISEFAKIDFTPKTNKNMEDNLDKYFNNAAGNGHSYAEFGLDAAIKMLKEINDSDVEKYVIFIGDGQYSYKNNTCRDGTLDTGYYEYGYNLNTTYCKTPPHKDLLTEETKSIEGALKTLKNLIGSNNIYSIQYDNGHKCNLNEKWMKYIGGKYYDARKDSDCKSDDASDYSNIFTKIFSDIQPKISTKRHVIYANIEDKVGNEFKIIKKNIKNGSELFSGKTIQEDINQNSYTTALYTIELKDNVETNSSRQANNLWHKTNSNFKLYVADDNGTLASTPIFSKYDDQPEVYYSKSRKDFQACSDNVSSGDSKTLLENDYIVEKCEQYKENPNGMKSDGFTANLEVNNNNLANKNYFSISNGSGFPITLTLANHVTCTHELVPLKDENGNIVKDSDGSIRYVIEDDYYNLTNDSNTIKEYIDENNIPKASEIQNTIDTIKNGLSIQIGGKSFSDCHDETLKKISDLFDKSSDDDRNKITNYFNQCNAYNDNILKLGVLKNQAEIKNKINNIETILAKYQTDSDDILYKTLNTYRNRFFNDVNPKVTIKYDNSSLGVDELYLEETNNMINTVRCYSNTSKVSVGKYSIISNKTCNLEVKKVMEFKNTCIDIKTASQVDCNPNSLNGGRYYYHNSNGKKAYISLDVDNVDFFGNDVKLVGDEEVKNDKGDMTPKCYFTVFESSNDKIIYRQIDNSDPFIQDDKYNSISGKRSIGTNYKNNQYNFTNVIKADVWSNNYNPMYTYTLSKQDIENIKKDTASKPNAYSMDDCKVNNDNTYYICSFTRDQDSNNKLFTNVSINEKLIEKEKQQ